MCWSLTQEAARVHACTVVVVLKFTWVVNGNVWGDIATCKTWVRALA